MTITFKLWHLYAIPTLVTLLLFWGAVALSSPIKAETVMAKKDVYVCGEVAIAGTHTIYYCLDEVRDRDFYANDLGFMFQWKE